MREISLRGYRLRIADDKPTFWAKAAAGGWEPETLAAMEDSVGKGAVFLDIGAWVGPTALYAACLGAKVVALEPDPAAFSQLAANVAANPGLAPRMRLIAAAATPRGGRIRLGIPRKPGDSMGSELLVDRAARAIMARAIAPADIAAALPAGPVIAKIDIEGGEYALLPALGPVLPRLSTALVAFHPDILREVGADDAAIRGRTDAAFAAFAGFAVRPLGPGGDGAAPAASRNRSVRFERQASP